MSGGDGEVAFFDNVGLRYGTGKEILTDVSFSLWPGSFYFLTGASGAGVRVRPGGKKARNEQRAPTPS